MFSFSLFGVLNEAMKFMKIVMRGVDSVRLYEFGGRPSFLLFTLSLVCMITI